MRCDGRPTDSTVPSLQHAINAFRAVAEVPEEYRFHMDL